MRNVISIRILHQCLNGQCPVRRSNPAGNVQQKRSPDFDGRIDRVSPNTGVSYQHWGRGCPTKHGYVEMSGASVLDSD
ncbi:hypothetical protein [Microcystis sp. M061S2]|uniref:hypothetical protein n=1 Tax=Microcystis sp. M061S2 TaxID=2771171 RepID=UPI0025886217|nr:hypothetical protein [Microcystis sp. M061S2]MCA2655948.1 hypothetical protein [Microcystis sp. M061S2]